MAKRRLTVSVRIPLYQPPRNAWRRQIHAIVRKRMAERGVKYRDSDDLELVVRLYLPPVAIRFHDVDNRLKDIMDALQGHVGGSKAKRQLVPLIPNDVQIYRVTVEKALAPRQSHGRGHLKIRRYRRSVR